MHHAAGFVYNVGDLGKKLEGIVTLQPPKGTEDAMLASLLDISTLTYKERDSLAEIFRSYRGTGAYDMEKAWDIRCRKLLGDRFDFKKNMVSCVDPT